MPSDDRHTLKHHFQQQFAYDLWASERVIAAVAEMPDGDAKQHGLRLLGHALRATTRWVERVIDGKASTRDKVDAPDAMLERARANTRAWMALLDERTAADFTKDVTYEMPEGEERVGELRVIVAHVLNHATHHRAQAVRHIRLAGGTPPSTDLIDWDFALQEDDEGA